MWIDAHAHLYDYLPHELPEVLREAMLQGVGVIVSTATSLENCTVVCEQAVSHPMVWAAVGVSPFDAESTSDDTAAALETLCASDKVLAIGEIGIDATNPVYPPLDKQIPLFELQLSVAKKVSLPVIIHSRGSEEQAALHCQECGVSDVVFHCFTGSRPALRKVVDYGYYVSLSGIVTFKNFELRNYIRDIPIDRLLIETDCPYLAPVPHRGKKNQPAWVSCVGKEVAALYGVTEEVLAETIEGNFRGLFRRYSAAR